MYAVFFGRRTWGRNGTNVPGVGFEPTRRIDNGFCVRRGCQFRDPGLDERRARCSDVVVRHPWVLGMGSVQQRECGAMHRLGGGDGVALQQGAGE